MHAEVAVSKSELHELQATSVVASTIFSDGLYTFIGVSLRLTEQQ